MRKNWSSFIKCFFLIGVLSLPLMNACNQNGLGALTATKNLITTPIRAISGAISQNRYDGIAESNTNKSSGELSSTACLGVPSPVMDIDPYEGLMEAARDNVCTCRPWGTCRKNLCSCEKLCPQGFDIFRRKPLMSSTEDLSTKENSLAFRNDGAMRLSSIEGTQGYCWGHASMTTKFNRLGFFQPGDKKKYEALDAAPGSAARTEAVEYYKEIIDDIADNKVREIPGFANLYELSSHPDLQSYIADKVAYEWADRAMTFQGMTTALGTSAMNREDADKFIENVREKLSHNYQPQIVFTGEGKMGFTHAVLVSGIRTIKGQTVLCLRDNNYRPSNNANCDNRLFYSERTKGFYYSGFGGELGKVVVAHNNEADVVDQHRSLRDHCQNVKACP